MRDVRCLAHRGRPGRARGAEGRHGSFHRPRRLHEPLREARPRGRAGDALSRITPALRGRSSATAAPSRSSSATRSWRCSARRSPTRTTPSVPCAPRSRSVTRLVEDRCRPAGPHRREHGRGAVALGARPVGGRRHRLGRRRQHGGAASGAAPVNGILVGEGTTAPPAPDRLPRGGAGRGEGQGGAGRRLGGSRRPCALRPRRRAAAARPADRAGARAATFLADALARCRARECRAARDARRRARNRQEPARHRALPASSRRIRT